MLRLPSLEGLFSEFDSVRNSSVIEYLSPEQLSKHPFLRHPLGFVHVVLGRQGPYALRLHIWPELARYEQQPYWPIHNHKFDLLSTVLLGTLTNRRYRVEPSECETDHYFFDVTYEDNGSTLSSTGIHVSVEPHATEDVIAPACYSVDAGIFHESWVPAGLLAATLALTRDSAENLNIRTVGNIREGSRHRYLRSPIGESEKDEIIAKLSELF